jgi:hypothetical protein
MARRGQSGARIGLWKKPGDNIMFPNVKFWSVLAALVCIAIAPMTNSASAVTPRVEKKCNALTAKAFPPRVIGNPAAGSAKGTGESERAYFRKCVANGGSM